MSTSSIPQAAVADADIPTIFSFTASSAAAASAAPASGASSAAVAASDASDTVVADVVAEEINEYTIQFLLKRDQLEFCKNNYVDTCNQFKETFTTLLDSRSIATLKQLVLKLDQDLLHTFATKVNNPQLLKDIYAAAQHMFIAGNNCVALLGQLQRLGNDMDWMSLTVMSVCGTLGFDYACGEVMTARKRAHALFFLPRNVQTVIGALSKQKKTLQLINVAMDLIHPFHIMKSIDAPAMQAAFGKLYYATRVITCFLNDLHANREIFLYNTDCIQASLKVAIHLVEAYNYREPEWTLHQIATKRLFQDAFGNSTTSQPDTPQAEVKQTDQQQAQVYRNTKRRLDIIL
jgi:hypothetical protein